MVCGTRPMSKTKKSTFSTILPWFLESLHVNHPSSFKFTCFVFELLSTIFFFVLLSHGQQWDDFRSKVHQTMMQPNTAKKYFAPLNQITIEFLDRIEERIKPDHELDCDFMEELYKWALECKSIAFAWSFTRGEGDRDVTPGYPHTPDDW